MAANSVLVGNALGLGYQTGVDFKGNDVFKGQSFKNISINAHSKMRRYFTMG